MLSNFGDHSLVAWIQHEIFVLLIDRLSQVNLSLIVSILLRRRDGEGVVNQAFRPDVEIAHLIIVQVVVVQLFDTFAQIKRMQALRICELGN